MDLAFALMAFPNMIAVFALAPKVMKETRRFYDEPSRILLNVE